MADRAELRVMSFNIWRSGGRSLGATIDAIRAVEADVVGLQECKPAVAQTIANELGAHWIADENDHAILSRYPIVETMGPTLDIWGGLGATIDVAGSRIHLFDAHLQWVEYGPYSLHEKRPEAFVLARERQLRLGGLFELLALMEPALASGEATFLVGDFNAPSHLDYPTTLAWPTSTLCVARGLEDSYRTVNPAPRRWSRDAPFAFEDPGITWSPLRSEEVRGVFDRIDFVYHAPRNGTNVVSSVTLDETNCVAPWPSDHRAVVSRFTMGSVS